MRTPRDPLSAIALASALLAAAPFPASAHATQEDPRPKPTTQPLTPAEEDLPPAAPVERRADPLPELFEGVEVKDPDDEVIRFSAEVLETYVTFFPGRSTRIGVGSYDDLLGDFRKGTIAGFLGSYKGYLSRLEKLPASNFTEKGILEKEALKAHLRSTLWSLEVAGEPSRDPNFYVDESIGAVQALLDRTEGSRMKTAEQVLARVEGFGKIFAQARGNLEAAPKPAVRRAIMRLRSSMPLFQREITTQIARSGHPRAKEAPEAAAAAWKEAAALADWLEKERLPKAPMPAPLGEKGWRDWLATREESAPPPAHILSIVEKDVARLQKELRAAAAEIDAEKPAHQVLREAEAEQLTPDSARRAAEDELAQLFDWMVRKKPLGLSEEYVLVRETPPFRRRDAPVRAELPGGYAPPEAVGFLEISAPDPEWPPGLLTPWLSSYGKHFLPVALMREVFPGRFAAWQKMRQSKIRACRALSYPAMTEGWPLYAAEVAVRGGYGADDPKLKLAMLAGLIRANNNLIAAIRLHVQRLAPEKAVVWLAKENAWPVEHAAEVVERLLAEPDTAAPALGRLAILALRSDVEKAMGKGFSEREFNERLLAHGQAPLSAVRKVLFPGTGDSLLGDSAPK